MQYWLYAFKYYKGNVLIDKYDTLEEAKIGRDRLDPMEYEYADILKMEWGKQPKLVSTKSFEYEKAILKIKKLSKGNRG